MNPLYSPVKAEEYREYGGQSSLQYSYSPVAIEGLHDTGPAPFLIKTFDMVDDPTSNGIVSWNRGGQSIVVWDAHAFSTRLLPAYFKHNNFCSFVRQLNTYGFRKTDPDRWEFSNESFLQGQKHLLKNIRRRKSHSQPAEAPDHPCLDNQVDQLRRDKQVLFMELVKLRQQQQATKAYLQSMELRLQGTEKKQQHMMSFLAKAMQNPVFLQQLVQQKEKRNQLEEAFTKKRRRPIDQGDSNEVGISFSSIKAESLYGGDHYQVSELEALALEMQGFSKANRVQKEVAMVDRGEFDWGFWDELLNQEVFDELENLTGLEVGEEEEDVNVLADKLGFLGSSSNTTLGD